MESLSQVLKLLKNPKYVQRADEKTKEIIQHPLIQKWLSKQQQLPEEILKVNIHRLMQYIKEFQQCTVCPGLERCPNDFQGHYTKLSVEYVYEQPQILDTKISCKKLTAYKHHQSIKARIRTFYIDDRMLEQGYSAEEILRIDLDRVKSVRSILTYINKTKESGLQQTGLYLVGAFGTGKTFLMCYMLYELAKEGMNGVIIYMPDFVEDLKGMFQEPQKLKETIEMLKETDLLVFDDLGSENLNPWVRDHVMGAILNYRMNRKPTFFTSNYDLDALQKHFSFTNKDGDEEYKGQRIMDRIRPFVEVIMVNGENKRGKT